MLFDLAAAGAVEKVIGGTNPCWWPLQQAGRSSSLATGETTVTTCFRYTCIKWGESIQVSNIPTCLRMARLMPLLLAAASAQELHGVSIFSTPPLLPPSPPPLYLAPQTSPLQPSQNYIYPYSPFYFHPYQLSNFPTLQPFFFSTSPQVE